MRTASDQHTARAAAVALPAADAGGVTGAQWVARFPPRPVAVSWPATEAGRSQVLARVLAAPFALEHPLSQAGRRNGVLAVLNWLAT